MGHRTEQSQPTTSIGQTDSPRAQRTLNESDEIETLPCISPRPDSLVKTQQNQAERQSIEQDLCSNSYRSKGPEDVDLPFKNNSMCIICFSHKELPPFSSIFFMASSKENQF